MFNDILTKKKKKNTFIRRMLLRNSFKIDRI